MSSKPSSDTPRPLRTFWQPRYWPIWLALAGMRLLAICPYRMQLAVGRGLGRLAGLVLRGRRHIAEVNLSLCFPELDASGRNALLRRHFESLGMTLVEHGLGWWASAETVERLVEVRGAEHLQEAMAGGRGVVLVAGHFASLEITGRAFSALFPSVAALYRSSRNPFVDEILKRLRHKSVPLLIPKQNMRGMVRALRQGMPVWYAPDQSYRGEMSALLPFCGEPAMTNTALSDIVRLGKAAVVPLVPRRLPDGRGYVLEIFPALDDFPGESAEADARRVSSLIEAQIRATPEQYYWIHRRFKDRPPPLPDPYR
ncbi:MAG: LpxL/LpxP family Kdo(2)-lipid IV(A) lauroyl/palmitoleoyl acyltransferase [Gammaproteobacteria bacterium]